MPAEETEQAHGSLVRSEEGGCGIMPPLCLNMFLYSNFISSDMFLAISAITTFIVFNQDC